MGSDWDVEWVGEEELEGRINELGDGIRNVFGAALMKRIEPLMTTSIKKTPVDTGALRRSANVAPPKYDIKGVYVVFGYAKRYAMAVHEMPGTLKGEPRSESPDPIQGTGRGKHWDPQGEAEPQFLRKAIDEHTGGRFLRDVADFAKEFLRGDKSFNVATTAANKFSGGEDLG